MRVGISSYTYVWSMGVPGYPPPAHPMTAFQLLDEAASLGVGVVQIADNLPLHSLSEDELQRLATRAADLGIDIETGTRGIDPRGLLTYLNISERLGSPILRTVIDPESSSGAGLRGTALASVPEVVRVLRDVAGAFERRNVMLAIENHDRFPALTLQDIMLQVHNRHVGICFDTANSIGCLEGASTVLETLAPWVVNVHLKDFEILRPPHNKGFVVEGRPLGGGQLDVQGLLSRLRDVDYAGSLIVELWPPPQSSVTASMELECEWARQSVRFLQQLLAAKTDRQRLP